MWTWNSSSPWSNNWAGQSLFYFFSVPRHLDLVQAVDVAADKFGDREGLVVVQQDVKRNFSELKQEIEALAAGLVELGLKPGERLGIWGPNTHEWYVLDLKISQIKTAPK